jgi:glutathione S-transferase
MQKVPVLVDGDFVLWESNAILAYLAAKFPQTNALPTDPQGRAEVDRWMHWQNAHLLTVVGGIKTGDKTEADLLPLLKVLDGQLEGRDYICGDLTIADFAVAAYLLTSNTAKFDYSAVPNVAAWRQRLDALPAFEETAFKLPPAAA